MPMRLHSVSSAVTRRDFLTGLGAAAALAALPRQLWAADAAKRPNVIVILTDDQGWSDLSCYGHERLKTPHIDALAATGIRCTAFYSAAPICSPSRAALLTGRSPERNGLTTLAEHGIYLQPTENTIASVLKKAGYATCMLGKWHVSNITDKGLSPAAYGFDEWFATNNNGSHVGLRFDGGESKLTTLDKIGGGNRHGAAICVEHALKWMDSLPKEQPFFLYLPFHTPHEEIGATAGYLKQYADVPEPKRTYYADITEMDAAVGELVAGLKKRGLRGNTFIHFSSDNGPEYRRGNPGSCGPYRGGKLSVFEGGIRVPGIVSWPDRIKPGQTTDVPWTNMDLLPTICAVTGTAIPSDRTLDGADASALLLGRATEVKRTMPIWFTSARGPGGQAGLPPMHSVLRDGQWKLMADRPFENFLLYNLEADPGEKTDLAGKHPDRAAEMKKRLRALLASAAKERR